VRRPREWVFLLLAFIVLFATYRYTFYGRWVAPLDGYFYADSGEFIHALSRAAVANDFVKHPLFFLLMRGLLVVLRTVGFDSTDSMASVFAGVGALNALLAFAWFRRIGAGFRQAAVLLPCYGFSFVIWVYASIYETCIFSALMTNVVLLTLWPKGGLLKWRHIVTAAAACVLAGTAHIPLLAFSMLIPLRLLLANPSRKILPTLIWPVAIVAIFLVAHTGLCRLRSAGEPPPVSAGIQSAIPDIPILRAAGRTEGPFRAYAGAHNLTSAGMAEVLRGQFWFAFCGLRFPFAQGISTQANRGDLFCCAILLSLALLLLYAAGVNLAFRTRLLATAIALVAPYLAFFWYFNPSEMVLYAPPLLSFILAGASRGLTITLKNDAVPAFALLGIILVLHNAIVLRTFP
jgi:hypothetical protein